MDDIRDWSQRAFELAFFIHRDRSVACRIVTEAMDQVDTVAQVQTRRSYYRAIGRRGRQPHRDKISLRRPALLQHLICLESERPDRAEVSGSRRGAELDDSDYIVRFLVFLACLVLARNAFYASVGIGRLLYRYATDEVIQLYDVLIQDPERYRGADALRACKRKLMNDILSRFGPTVRVRRASRGEKVLESRPAHDVPTHLVVDTLGLLTPWGTECSIGPRVEPLLDEISDFHFTDCNPDREHDYELRRLHTLFHPTCFERLVAALGFTAPEDNLMLPIFFTERSGQDDDPRQRFTAPISPDERRAIEEELGTRSRRRAPWKPGRLSVYADGVSLLGTLDPSRDARRSFQVLPTVRTLEVLGEHPDGPIRLAVFVTIGMESTVESQAPSVVRLAEGQEISFRLKAAEGGLAVDRDAFDVEIQYRETAIRRAWALGMNRFRARTASWLHRGWISSGPGRLAAATLLALAIGGAVLIGERPSTPWLGGAAGTTETQGDRLLHDPTRGIESSPETTRSLRRVEAIHVGSWSQHPELRPLSRQLISRLERGDRFRVAHGPDGADAMLALATAGGEVEPLGETSAARVELINRAGEVLWRFDFELGPTEATAERLVESLEAAAAR